MKKMTQSLTRTLLVAASVSLVGCAAGPGEIDAWPITNAEQNGFTGEVVDVLCELNGNCAENCGNGARQLAVKTTQGETILIAKNLNNYSGAVDELSPFCNQMVEINGLFTEHRNVRFFQVQNVRAPGGQWQKATVYAKAWAERSGKSPALASDWQDHDDRVQEIIARDGSLGLGKEADAEYFK